MKQRIYEESSGSFVGRDPKDLVLTKIDVDLQTIRSGRIQASSNPLDPWDNISDVWTGQPPNRRAHVLIRLPGVGSPTLIGDRFEERMDAKTSGLWPAITVDATTRANSKPS